MGARNINHEAQALALGALAWTLEERARAERLLSVTGLTPQGLRARAADSAVQAAVIGFLESHEPDLIACAAALDCAPAALVAARTVLETV